MISSFNYIENDTNAVLFNNETLDFYRVFDVNLKNKLKGYFNNGIYSKEIVDMLNNIYVKNYNDNKKRFKEEMNENQTKILQKLTILTTNNCNLQCKYCYASGGSYNQEIQDLSCEEAKKIVDYFVTKCSNIKLVFFFGGEPLLNYEVIGYVCHYFNKLKSENKINYIPNFAVITNGTILTDEIIDILVKYRFMITISVDGDEIIQNYLRPNKLGNDTFNAIIKNYNELIKKGFIKNRITFECTYTREHVLKNITFINLLKFFHNKFDVDIVHIAPVCIDSDDILSLTNYQDTIAKYIKELVEYTFNTMLNEKIIKSCSFILSILDRIISHTQMPYTCPVRINSLSIAKDGIIRPCFVFSGSKVSVGNLQSTIDDLINRLSELTITYNKKNLYKKCKSCYARNICSSCLTSYGSDLDKPDFYYGANSMCTIMKTLISNMFLKLVEIKSNKEDWKILNEVISKYSV